MLLFLVFFVRVLFGVILRGLFNEITYTTDLVEMEAIELVEMLVLVKRVHPDLFFFVESLCQK